MVDFSHRTLIPTQYQDIKDMYVIHTHGYGDEIIFLSIGDGWHFDSLSSCTKWNSRRLAAKMLEQIQQAKHPGNYLEFHLSKIKDLEL